MYLRPIVRRLVASKLYMLALEYLRMCIYIHIYIKHIYICIIYLYIIYMYIICFIASRFPPGQIEIVVLT